MEKGNSIQLDASWDICLDDFGNLKTCKGDTALCQDVACALRLFTNDSYYEPQKGIPYFDIALGIKPFESLVRCELTKTAKEVIGILDVSINNFEISKERNLSLSVACFTVNGAKKEFNLSFDTTRAKSD